MLDRKYIGKRIIAWLSYDKNFVSDRPEYSGNNVCYVTPRFINDGTSWELISSDDFQSFGSIAVHLAGGKEASEFIKEMGFLAIIWINDLAGHSHLYPTTKRTQYHMSYTSKLRNPQRESEIWIEPFSEVQSFYQIVEEIGSLEELKLTKKIIKNTEIYTREVFVKMGDYLYGPFRQEKANEKTIRLFSKDENQYLIGKYSSLNLSDIRLDIQDNYNNIALSFIDRRKFSLFTSQADEKIDWLTDEELVKFLTDTVKQCQVMSKEKLDEIGNILSPDGLINLDERRSRLQELLRKAIQKYDFVQSLSSVIMSNEGMKNDFIRKLPDYETFWPIDDNKKYKEALEELERSEKNVDELREKITQLEERPVEQRTIIQPDIELKQKYDDLKSSYEDLVQTSSNLSKMKEELQDTEQKIKEADAEYEKLVVKKQAILDEVQKSIGSLNEASIIAQKIDTKLMDSVLRVISGDKVKKETRSSGLSYTDKLFNYEPNDLIQHTEEKLNECGRSLTHNDTVNILTCLAQGFITTFAGEPGTGKTSLCGLLARALGLARKDEYKRFVEVSVERGWTSVKDFIGYYNPLMRSMEQSNAEVFNAIQVLNNEKESADKAPFWILLDEANLSPIEHYWANFLKFCDSDNIEDRLLTLGGDERFFIPNNLRFLATVNFDHTTEELSPRFLDRSWIITLKPSEDIEIAGILENDDLIASHYAFSLLNTEVDTIDKDKKEIFIFNDDKWRKIQALFHDCGFQIMPRNQKIVRKYMATVSRYMNVSSISDQYAPLDYALSQKILTEINGSGDRYKRLIEGLYENCGNLPLSKEHLQRIMTLAEQNMGYYQFFAR